MQGRAFLDLAREMITGKTEAHWRAAAVHAYYALMLECRDAQARWGLPVPPRHTVHAQVRLRLVYARNADLQTIGDALDRLVQNRNKASYDLRGLKDFTSSTKSGHLEQVARHALDLLDQIDNNPARRAAAIASLPP